MKIKEDIIPEGDEYIYFVAESPFTGFVKIGKTTCIEKRLSGMQTGNPRKLDILLKLYRPVKYDYERIFHKLLSHKHTRGEWYLIDLNTLMRIEIITRSNKHKEELSCLFSEFIKYDSDWVIGDDKIFINCPEVKSGRCGSRLHGKIIPKKIKRGEIRAADKKPKHKLISVDCDLIAKSEEISEDKFSKLSSKNRLSSEERSSVNKHILRTKYLYAGEMDQEWIKKYSNEKVLLMNKHIITRDININELASSSEYLIENMTDIKRLTKRRTAFMYNVARVKIRDIYDKYNKTFDLPSKMMEYVNQQIEINNPIFGSKKLNSPNTRFVLNAVNDILIAVGYEIRILRVHKKTSDSKNIYEFEWFDMVPDYYNLPDKTEKNEKKPDFPVWKHP